MSRLIRMLLSLIVLVIPAILLTCSDDGLTDPDDGAGGIQEITVTPQETSAAPMSMIPLSGIPSDVDSVYAVVMSLSKQIDSAYSIVMRTDSGDFLIAPLNPSNPLQGGEVEIVVTDGATIESVPITFAVDTLPEAPGEFDAIVSLLQEMLDHKLRLHGLTRDSLSSLEPGDVPILALPLYVAFDGLDNPDNPNSLRALADGTAPGLLGDTLRTEVLNRLFGVTGYRAYLEDVEAGFDSITGQLSPSARSTTLGQAARQASGMEQCLPAPEFMIGNCEQLAAAMRYQYSLQMAGRSAANQVKKDATTIAMTVATLIPGLAFETTAIGGAMWLEGKLKEGAESLYPSEFVDEATSFDPSETAFPEDFEDPGFWTEFLVTAKSKGWNLDQTILEAIMQGLGAKDAVESLDNVPANYAENLSNHLQGFFIGNGTNAVIGEFADGSGIVRICSNTWSNVDCAGEEYSRVEYDESMLDVSTVSQTYEPLKVGGSILRIETANIFGEAENTGTAETIACNAIEVFIDPFRAEADTSELVEFNVRVEHALDERVEWTLEGGGTMVSSDVSSATVKTPGTPWDPPLNLRAKSLANTGLREGKVDADPRNDEAPVIYGTGEVIIEPYSICLQPGHTQQFDAAYIGGSIGSIEWTTDPPGVGTLEPVQNSVLYTAPDEHAGQILLMAIVNGQDTGYANVDISTCVCYWEFNAFGDMTRHITGERALASDYVGALQVGLALDTDHTDPPDFNILTRPEFNGVGIYDSVYVLFTDVGYEGWWPIDSDVPMPVLEIVEYVPGDYLRGVITGELQHFRDASVDPPILDRITISLSFRAEYGGGVHDRPCATDQ